LEIAGLASDFGELVGAVARTMPDLTVAESEVAVITFVQGLD
jgi:hypothetical protein